MSKFVLGVILDNTLQHALLVKSLTGEREGLLNFLGNQVKEGDTPLSCMISEFMTSTGFKLTDAKVFKYLLSEKTPQLEMMNTIEMHVFYFVLKEKKEVLKPQTNIFKLEWFDIQGYDLLRTDNPMLTGNGTISYYINFAKRTAEAHSNLLQPVVQDSNNP
jgi:hypothetical protein